jgi:hypothetical protein
VDSGYAIGPLGIQRGLRGRAVAPGASKKNAATGEAYRGV